MPTCEAEEVKAAERGEAGVLICDMLQYQGADRRASCRNDGIKVKGVSLPPSLGHTSLIHSCVHTVRNVNM
jgi:hypothetical protein